MSVLKPDKCASDGDIIFLYRLVPGHSPLSYGIHCAWLAGLPEEVVERATNVLEATKSNMPVGRLVNQKILAKDQQYKDAVTKMLEFDAYKGDLKQFF